MWMPWWPVGAEASTWARVAVAHGTSNCHLRNSDEATLGVVPQAQIRRVGAQLGAPLVEGRLGDRSVAERLVEAWLAAA